MPMFKKGKSDSGEAAADARPQGAAVVSQAAPAERAARPEAVIAVEPVKEAAPTPGSALLEGIEKEEAQEEPAAKIDDEATSSLMHIFTEDKEGLNASATIYEAFLDNLTMEQVAANAQALLDELRSIG